jgi:hypothetical protein
VRRYRFIVARGNERLYEHLVRSLAGLDEIEIMMDRRAEKRRHGGGSGRPSERRVLNRVDEDLKTFGWAFVKIERGPA